MNDHVEDFVKTRLPIGGLVAYVITTPHRLLRVDCLSRSVYPSTAEQMLRSLVQAGRELLPTGKQPARYCWIFENLRVYVAVRADGISLGLLVENDTKTRFDRIQETAQTFLELAES